MGKKKLSLRGLSKYMTASAHAQRKILREFKYPNEAGAAAMRHYYVPATEAILLHHADNKGEDWLQQRASALEADAASTSQEGKRRKLKSNATALRHYARHFAARKFKDVKRGPTWSLAYEDVVISVRPDLHVLENGTEKVIRLGFPLHGVSTEAVKIMAQGLLAAASQSLGLGSSQVLYFDLPRGTVTKGRAGAKLGKDIKAACATISTLWDSITRVG